MTMQKKKNKYKTISISANDIYLLSAVITGILGLVTPLISFEIGVFGFCVLVLFTICTLFTMKTHWQGKLFTLTIVLLASHRLLFYAFILALLYSCDSSCFY